MQNYNITSYSLNQNLHFRKISGNSYVTDILENFGFDGEERQIYLLWLFKNIHMNGRTDEMRNGLEFIVTLETTTCTELEMFINFYLLQHY